MEKRLVLKSLVLEIVFVFGVILSSFHCFNDSFTEANFNALCRYKGKCLNCSDGGCEDMCQFYDNKCCLNSTLRYPKLEKWQYSCVRRYPDMYDLNLDCRGSFKGVYGVYMVDKCSKLWTDGEIKRKCGSPENDLLSRIPVYDTTNKKLTFKNMYCAFCNWLSLERLRFWKFDRMCDDRLQALVNMTGSRADSVPDSCFIRMINKEHKMCAFDVTEKCKDGDKVDSSLKDMCENGLPQNVYVWKSGNVFSIYKNEYCARCNDETGTLQCWAFQAFTCWPQDLPSYTKVQAKVELRLYGQDNGNTKHILNSTCGHGVVYDPFSKSCLNVTCLLSQNTCISGKCNLVEISTSDFEIRNNSYLYVMALDIKVDKGRYFHGGLTTHVCLDDEQIVQLKMLQETTQQTLITSAILTSKSSYLFQIRSIFVVVLSTLMCCCKMNLF